MLISRKQRNIISFALFIILFFLVNIGIDFALKPYDGMSARIWDAFYEESNVDMIYFGSSIGNRAYDPETVDAITGLKSFNLSSNDQPIVASYWGIKKVLNDRPIRFVILNLDYSNIGSYENNNAKVSYMQALSQYESLWHRISDYIMLARDCGLKEKESINVFFPWIYNHVSLNRRAIIDNIHKKIDYSYASTHEGNADFLARGHIEPKNVEYKSINLDKDIRTNSKNHYKIKDSHMAISSKAYQTFEDIINLCQREHVKLIVTFAPRPAFDSLSLGNDYFHINSELRDFFASYGIPFYDFNMLKKDFWTNSDRYYYNFEHLNQYGSESFSAAFARFFNKLQAGEDVSSLFYTKEEYLTSIDYIAGVLFNTRKGRDKIFVHALSYHGLYIKPEYEIQVYDEQTGDLISTRGYGADTDYSFAPAHKGAYRIRVNARQVGSEIPYERYCEKKVAF